MWLTVWDMYTVITDLFCFPEKVFASLPHAERGKSVRLSGDPKGEHFLYCNGQSVFIRNLQVNWLSVDYTLCTPRQHTGKATHFVESTMCEPEPSNTTRCIVSASDNRVILSVSLNHCVAANQTAACKNTTRMADLRPVRLKTNPSTLVQPFHIIYIWHKWVMASESWNAVSVTWDCEPRKRATATLMSSRQVALPCCLGVWRFLWIYMSMSCTG